MGGPRKQTPTIRGGRRVHAVYVVAGVAFVPHPLFHGSWVRTDLSVVKVACTYPDCGSAVGVPCMGVRYKNGATVHTGYTSSTHYTRRLAAKGMKVPGEVNASMVIKLGDST